MTARRTILLVVLLLVPPMTVAVIGRSMQYPKRFAEVIPQGLYRGAFPTSEHICRLADEKNVKTIVSLTSYMREPKYEQEIAAARDAGITLLRFPMPGNGCGSFEELDGAADALADQTQWPIFFHCNAGKQRSNAALAAYRMKHCGWTLDKALDELDEYGLDRSEEAVLCDHLAKYAEHLEASKGRGGGSSGVAARPPAASRPGPPGQVGPVQFPARKPSVDRPDVPVSSNRAD